VFCQIKAIIIAQKSTIETKILNMILQSFEIILILCEIIRFSHSFCLAKLNYAFLGAVIELVL